MFRTPIRTAVFVLALLALARPAAAEVLLESGDWQAIKDAENGKPVCVLSAVPAKSEGKYSKRGDVFLFITHRPAEKRFFETGFQAGYAYQDGGEATATVDGKTAFSLFTQGEFAWTRSGDDDRALVKALRGGGQLVIQGASARGTRTTDTFSLKGFSAALDAANTACGAK